MSISCNLQQIILLGFSSSLIDFCWLIFVWNIWDWHHMAVRLCGVTPWNLALFIAMTTFEFNLKKLSKFDFHCLSIFLYDLKLIWLKNFYDVIKLNPWISLKYTNIQDFLGLSIDDKFMVMLLLLKNESHGHFSLFGNIVFLAFHGDILLLFLLLRSLILLTNLKGHF